MLCGCPLCSGAGGFEAVETTAEGWGAGTKPSFGYDQAAQQLTRNVSPIYLPNFPSSLSLTYAYRQTSDAPTPPVGTTNWIGGLNSDMGGFQPFNGQQIQIMETMVQMVRDIANVTLMRVGSGTSGAEALSDNAQLLIGNYTTGAATSYGGWGAYNFKVTNGVYARAGKVWVDGSETSINSPTAFNRGASLFVHELMHTLGLSHPGDYNVTRPGYSYDESAVYAEDSRQYSAMSYFDETETGANWADNSPMTPMIHDIAALQRLYGANLSTRTGDTIYGFNGNTGYEAMSFNSATSRRVFSIWDAGGVDTIDASGFATSSTLNLVQEAFSSAGTRSDGGLMINNIAIARGAVIENAIGGSGADFLQGNSAANRLVGNSGADRITGAGGNDTVDGGVGTDVAVFGGGRADYAVQLSASGAIVSDQTAGRDGADTMSSVERLRFSDGTLALDVALPGQGASDAGSAYRLYEAAFNRAPDLDGLSFWIRQLDAGSWTRDRMAQGFVDSAEFKQVYGADPSAQALVAGFYRNILGRDPERAGLDFWVGRLEGRPDQRAFVLDSIANSPENQQGLAQVIGQGIWLPGDLLL